MDMDIERGEQTKENPKHVVLSQPRYKWRSVDLIFRDLINMLYFGGHLWHM